MTCPVCGEKTEVYDTRAKSDSVRRQRACLKCKYTFSTIEIEEDLLQKITSKDLQKTTRRNK